MHPQKFGLTILLGFAISCNHSGTTQSKVSSQPSLPPADSPSEEPTDVHWWNDSTFYEIFVRSFKDADGDGIGDFKGLTSQLDILNDGDPNTDTDLGVTGIWLMPIHPSPSYHGYDVTNYRDINPQYGTLEDFDLFLAAAHDRGIRVIIDFVLNHSSNAHPWFKDAVSSTDAPYRNWYVWADQPNPNIRRPWDGSLEIWHNTPTGYYYGLFWEGMPDLNLTNPEVEKEMIESMKFWLARGVDGFRIDAVRYLIENPSGGNADLPATHAILKQIKTALREDYPDALVVAEAWTTRDNVAPYYGQGQEMDLAFGFDTAGAILSSAKDGLRANLNQTLPDLAEAYDNPNFEAPFLTNHDMVRVMRELTQTGAEAAARPAAATLFAMPGTPFIYYGEEIGMQGGPSAKDEDKRTPFRWNATPPQYGFTTGAAAWYPGDEAEGVNVSDQQSDPQSLWNLYRQLVALRSDHSILSQGKIRPVSIDGGGRGTTAFIRNLNDKQILFVVNFDRERGEDFVVSLDQAATSIEVLMAEGLEDDIPQPIDGKLQIQGLAPHGFAFIAL